MEEMKITLLLGLVNLYLVCTQTKSQAVIRSSYDNGKLTLNESGFGLIQNSNDPPRGMNVSAYKLKNKWSNTTMQGIWYLLQKINHTDQARYSARNKDCPIIHISKYEKEIEFEEPTKNAYDLQNGVRYTEDQWRIQDFDKEFSDDRNRDASKYKERERYPLYITHLYDTRYLRVYWDEGIHSTEYRLRYSMYQPGFWMTDQTDQDDNQSKTFFYGGIQVIKAVGNHLVLLFCDTHLSIDKKIFTLILTKEKYLEKRIIHNIHKQLQKQGLLVNAIENSCSSSSTNRYDINLLFISIISVIYFSVENVV
ncbi:uncharacterized protein [Euwallacea fornicatus]|uniref:uncharacterized protein n=1 Tax=Euwallacea fornicatus TaxID=995702 RepID=UPI00338E1B6C